VMAKDSCEIVEMQNKLLKGIKRE